MLDALVDVFFPPRCFGCGRHLLPRERAGRCCDSCQHTVHRVESPKCPVCALPRELRSGIDEVCGRCLASRPRFEAVHARWVYDGAVADAIRRSKAGGDPSSLFALIESDRAWFDDIGAMFERRTWTTPPVHPRDLVARGWNPSRAALRRAFGGALDVSDPLWKERRTTKQAKLGRAARSAGLKGAFECAERVSGEWVVFDDVMTTGATLQEAARALRKGGASNVIGVVLARSV